MEILFIFYVKSELGGPPSEADSASIRSYKDGTTKDEKKHRKLFGSLFKKKNKHDGKNSSTDDDVSVASGSSSSHKRNK